MSDDTREHTMETELKFMNMLRNLVAIGATQAQPVRHRPKTPRPYDPKEAARLRAERDERKAANYRKRHNAQPDDGREGET